MYPHVGKLYLKSLILQMYIINIEKSFGRGTYSPNQSDTVHTSLNKKLKINFKVIQKRGSSSSFHWSSLVYADNTDPVSFVKFFSKKIALACVISCWCV